MIFKKTEDNANSDNKQILQMKSSLGEENKVKSDNLDQSNLATIRNINISPRNGMLSDYHNPADINIKQGYINSGNNSSKEGKQMICGQKEKYQIKKEFKQKKQLSYADQVKQQYSKIKSCILREIISDEKETQIFFVLFLIILAFLIEQAVFKEYDEFIEYITILIISVLFLGQYMLLHYKKNEYLHYLQIVNSLSILIIIAMWVFYNQQQSESVLNDFTLQISALRDNQFNQQSSTGTTSSDAYAQRVEDMWESKRQSILLQLLQQESKSFFQSAILFRLQDCLNKHLIPKYRLCISIISAVVILILFYAKQQTLQDGTIHDFDIIIKCLFFILILAFYEQTQMSNLYSYLISFQALKKYFTVSLCSRSSHALSTNLSVQIDPSNLSSCQIIQGNQQLSDLLLSDPIHFFQKFQLDSQGISNYNSVDQNLDFEDRITSSEGDFRNSDFRAQPQKLNSNVQISQQKTTQQQRSVSNQFIDLKILKSFQTLFSRGKCSKVRNPSNKNEKRNNLYAEKGQFVQKDCKEGEIAQTIGNINTNPVFARSENLLQTFRNQNEGNGEIATKNTLIPNTITSPQVINPSKQSYKQTKQDLDNQDYYLNQNNKIIKQPPNANNSFERSNRNNLNTQQVSQQTRNKKVSIQPLIKQYQSLLEIIKDRNIRSVCVQGKYKKNEEGKTHHLSITLVKYYNIFQNETVIASITDITQIQEISNLQREVKFKETMFANVTHDLRTPLYAIKYSVDRLKEIFQIHQCNTLLEQKQLITLNIKSLQENEVQDLHEQINITIANTHLMEAIIQDIIDNNRNRMGKLEADIRQFNLMEMLHEMNKLMEIILWEKRKNIKIRFEICQKIRQNSMIYSDSQRLKQVLMNLISNSIKFTKRGGILIKVSMVYFQNTQNIDKFVNIPFKSNLKQKLNDLLEMNDNTPSKARKSRISSDNQQYQMWQDQIFSQGLIQFQIIDSGVGMNSKILNNIFTPYNTFNNNNMNNHGIGLGLSICKTIVEKLGPFQLTVASKEQRGSKFTFYIYHEIKQSMITSKLQALPSQDQIKQLNTSQTKQINSPQNNQLNNSQLNNSQNNQLNNSLNNSQINQHKGTLKYIPAHNFSHIQNIPQEDNQLISPKSFINLMPLKGEQNIRSEVFLEIDKNDNFKSDNEQNSNRQISIKQNLEQANNINNTSIQQNNGQQEKNYQSISFHQEYSIKINTQSSSVQRNGSIFQSYSQNNDNTNKNKANQIQFKKNVQYKESKPTNDSKQNDNCSLKHVNVNDSDFCLTRSPKFMSFNNYNSSKNQSLFHYINQSANVEVEHPNNNNNNNNNNENENTHGKANNCQKVSFGLHNHYKKKNVNNSVQDSNSKNNTLNVLEQFSEKDILEAHLSSRQNPLQTQISIMQTKARRETQDFLIPGAVTQNGTNGLNSTISSIVIGSTTANEKKDNEVHTIQTAKTQVQQDTNNNFTVKKNQININQVCQKHSVSPDNHHNLPSRIPVKSVSDDIFPAIQPQYHPNIKFAQSIIKKRLQDPKHVSYEHLKGLKTDYFEQNFIQNKAQLQKNLDSLEYQYSNEQSIYMNPLSQGAFTDPFNMQLVQSKLSNLKSQNRINNKYPSQTAIDQAKGEYYIDDQYLEEDMLFNTSILLSLEDNQEHINLEEDQANILIKNNHFQVMNAKKQSSPIIQSQPQKFSPQASNQKSVRESQICSVDKKALYISKIERYNHVTNQKMTESVQLNQIKQIKFGLDYYSDDRQEKQVLNILICDDSIFNIKILKKFLLNNKTYKMSIDSCLSGDEAIEKFLKKNKPNSQEPYNYIFLDWNMPILDGYETSLKLKFYVKDEQYLDCPIIICTAYEDTTEINKCLRNGTDGILTKPISQDKLNEILADFQQSKENYRRL